MGEKIRVGRLWNFILKMKMRMRMEMRMNILIRIIIEGSNCRKLGKKKRKKKKRKTKGVQRQDFAGRHRRHHHLGARHSWDSGLFVVT